MLLLRKVIRDGRWVDLENAHDDDLKAIWSALVAIHKEHLFWVGDILDEIEKRHGNDSAREAIKHSPDPDKFREVKIISQIFSQPIGRRRFNLDWRYYSEAVRECGKGNIEMALKWLEAAERNRWTMPQMRAAIRQSRVDSSPKDTEKAPRQLSATTVIRKATKALQEIVSTHPIDEWTLDETCAFADDTEGIAKILRDAQKRYDYLD
jgi:hypothetical protein